MSDKKPPEETPGAIDLDFTGVFTSAQLRKALENPPTEAQPAPPPAPPAAPQARPAPPPSAPRPAAAAPAPAAPPAARAAPAAGSTPLDKASLAAIAAAAAKAQALIAPKPAASAPAAAPPAAAARAAPTPPLRVPSAMIVGASAALAQNSYYINVAKKRPPARPFDPTKTTILMVEDDNTTRTVLSMVLSRSLGYQVRQAADARAFVAALQQSPLPDVLILDLELPGEVNGFRILDKVRKHPQLKNLPVIIFSGHTEARDLERALALGADAYLSKPAKVEAIIETLKAVLGG